MHNYRRAAERGDDLGFAEPDKARDPIAQYLIQTVNDNSKPARLAFKKNTKFKENEEDNEDQDKAKASIALKSYYISNKFASAFSKNLQINNNLNSLILMRTNLTD